MTDTELNRIALILKNKHSYKKDIEAFCLAIGKLSFFQEIKNKDIKVAYYLALREYFNLNTSNEESKNNLVEILRKLEWNSAADEIENKTENPIFKQFNASSNSTHQAQLNPKQLEAKQGLKEDATNISQENSIIGRGTLLKEGGEIEDSKVQTKTLYIQVQSRKKVKQKSKILGDEVKVDGPLKIEDSIVQTTLVQKAKRLSCLPETWHLPPKNEDFVGRTDLLSQVTNQLQQLDQPLLLTAFHGLGGIGKTQIALEFVHKVKNYKNYQGVVWFNAENRDRLQQEYIELGHELHILYGYEKASIWEQAKHVKEWLEDPSRAGWLLVYDNAPEYGGEKGIGDLIPTKQGKVVITSRYKIGWPHRSLDVNVFTPEESKAYIEKVLGQALSDENSSKCSQLAAILGHLPLALAQAAAYIKKNRLSLARYLELYKTRKQTLLADETLSRETLKPDSDRMVVFITWDITIDKIHQESPLAEHWLHSCAYLKNNDIPDFVFVKFSEDQVNNSKDEIYEAALGTLHSYSMIKVEGKNHHIHNVLQEVIQLKLESEKKSEEIIANTARLLHKCFPVGDTMEDYAKKRKLLPHYEALLPLLEKMLNKGIEYTFTGHLLVRSFVHIVRSFIHSFFGLNRSNEIHEVFIKHLLYQANAYGSLGEPKKQKVLLERAIKIQEHHYGRDHFKVAINLVNLGNAYGSLGAPEKKKELLERALKIKEHHYGPDHFEVAINLVNLGNAYGSLGAPEKQKELLERALKIQEYHYGPDHFQVAINLVNLGNAYGSLGAVEKQKELLERALKIQEHHYGPDHFQVSINLVNLGNAYGSLGAPEKQKELLERALIIQENHYGCDHFQVAINLVNLGNAYGSLGAPEKQKELLERALKIQEHHYGPDHFQVAINLVNLGNAYGSLGAPEKQKELLERALKIEEQHYGPDHFEVAINLISLGIAYGSLGAPEKQKELLERALKIQEYHYGPDNFEVAINLVNLGNAYGSLGAPEKKKELLERALKIMEHHYGPDHFEVAINLVNLGNAYGSLGAPEKQKELLERALKIKEHHYGPDHFQVAINLISLGIAYGSLGAPEKQKELLERALKIMEHHYGPDHFEVAINLVNLGNAYGSLGAPEKQKELLERALIIQENHYGPDHFQVAINLVNLGNAYGSLGAPEKQKELLERALIIQENHYGPDHFQVAINLVNLGNAYGSLGAPEKQKELLERALKIEENHYGPDHFEVAITLTNLGNAYGSLGAPEKQKELLERAIKIQEQYYGSNHFVVAMTFVNLGNVYVDFDNIQKACEAYKKASSILDEETPLQLAAKCGNLETVKYFLAKGLDVFARNSHDTLLHQAVSGNNKVIIKLILDKIMEKEPQNFLEHFNAKDTEGDTPLMWAAEKCNVSAAQILLDYGVDVNAIDNDGQTALHQATNFRYANDSAATQNYLKFIQLLLDHHADPNISDKNGKTPLDIGQKKLEQDPENGNLKVITAFLLSVTHKLNPHLFRQEKKGVFRSA